MAGTAVEQLALLHAAYRSMPGALKEVAESAEKSAKDIRAPPKLRTHSQILIVNS
jgi:hypothetical protein